MDISQKTLPVSTKHYNTLYSYLQNNYLKITADRIIGIIKLLPEVLDRNPYIRKVYMQARDVVKSKDYSNNIQAINDIVHWWKNSRLLHFKEDKRELFDIVETEYECWAKLQNHVNDNLPKKNLYKELTCLLHAHEALTLLIENLPSSDFVDCLKSLVSPYETVEELQEQISGDLREAFEDETGFYITIFRECYFNIQLFTQKTKTIPLLSFVESNTENENNTFSSVNSMKHHVEACILLKKKYFNVNQEQIEIYCKEIEIFSEKKIFEALSYIVDKLHKMCDIWQDWIILLHHPVNTFKMVQYLQILTTLYNHASNIKKSFNDLPEEEYSNSLRETNAFVVWLENEIKDLLLFRLIFLLTEESNVLSIIDNLQKELGNTLLSHEEYSDKKDSHKVNNALGFYQRKGQSYYQEIKHLMHYYNNDDTFKQAFSSLGEWDDQLLTLTSQWINSQNSDPTVFSAFLSFHLQSKPDLDKRKRHENSAIFLPMPNPSKFGKVLYSADQKTTAVLFNP